MEKPSPSLPPPSLNIKVLITQLTLPSISTSGPPPYAQRPVDLATVLRKTKQGLTTPDELAGTSKPKNPIATGTKGELASLNTSASTFPHFLTWRVHVVFQSKQRLTEGQPGNRSIQLKTWHPPLTWTSTSDGKMAALRPSKY